MNVRSLSVANGAGCSRQFKGRLRTLGALTVVLGLVALASPSAAASASPPPAGGYFTTLAPGSSLPSEGACASRVRRSAWEPRPENTIANSSVPGKLSLPGFTPEDGGMDIRARALADRVTGNFKGTTDEIIQWAACKWGFNDDTVRAQALAESTWYQATAGDVTSDPAQCQSGYSAPCPESFGLLQIKANTWRGTFPASRDATAFNLDYVLMVRRACFEGWVDWLFYYPGSTATYRSGDVWGCMGYWYEGTWYGPGARSYIDAVKKNYNGKPWRKWADLSGSAGGTVTTTTTTVATTTTTTTVASTTTTTAPSTFSLTAPATAARGAAVTVKWAAPAGKTSPADWIAIFRPTDANTNYGEWHYTGGATGGSMSFTAPSTAGTYHFRYLLNDGYTSVVTSAAMTVT